MPGSLNTACYQAVILHTFDVPTAAGNRPSRVTEYGIKSLGSLFVMLARALQSFIGRSEGATYQTLHFTHMPKVPIWQISATSDIPITYHVQYLPLVVFFCAGHLLMGIA